MADRHICAPAHAHMFLNWLQERGGISIWKSVNLSNPSASWSAPFNDAEGNPKTRPSWESDTKPERIITDPAEIAVQVDKVVERLPLFIKRRASMHIVLTDACSRKVRAAVEKAGIGAYYQFDGDEVVILAPDGQPVPLLEWVAANPEPGGK